MVEFGTAEARRLKQALEVVRHFGLLLQLCAFARKPRQNCFRIVVPQASWHSRDTWNSVLLLLSRDLLSNRKTQGNMYFDQRRVS